MKKLFLSTFIISAFVLGSFSIPASSHAATCGGSGGMWTGACTAGNCGTSLYTSCSCPSTGCAGDCVNGMRYWGTCSKACGDLGATCGAKLIQPVTSAVTIKSFYDFYYTRVNPTWSQITGSLGNGSKGADVLSLSIILEGFGFSPPILPSDTGANISLDANYGPTLSQAVIDLKKALKLPATGQFDPTTRESFATFYYDISSILIYPAANTTKFAIVYPGGVTSFFNGFKFDKPSAAVNSFVVTEPTFIMQDSAGKNFLWKNDKWNLTTTAFPTPKTTIPIKGNLSAFASDLSTVGTQINGNFSASRTVSSGFSSATVVPSILSFLYKTGFSTYNPLPTATTFGQVSTDATKSFQASVGITPTGIFDNNTAVAAKNINDQIVSAINAPSLPVGIKSFSLAFPGDKTISIFNPTTGTFIATPRGPLPLSPNRYNCYYDGEIVGTHEGSCAGSSSSGHPAGNTVCVGGCHDVF